jgi:iron complex transport system ATP-binding protein
MLEAKSISFRYSARGPWIFEDVTVTASAGEVLAVLGPNARGKTTMLKCLSGLLTPVAGTVTSSGTIGYVPQSHAVAFSFTVLDIVLMGRARKVRIYSSPTNADRDAALDALDRVGIPHLATRDYGGLSGASGSSSSSPERWSPAATRSCSTNRPPPSTCGTRHVSSRSCAAWPTTGCRWS